MPVLVILPCTAVGRVWLRLGTLLPLVTSTLLAAADVTWSALLPLPNRMPLLVKVLVPVPPLATVRALVKVSPAKVGLEMVAISWMVLITPLPLSVKLVALKVAIPLVVPSAAALLMVMVPALPELLASVSTPVWLSRLVTPPPAPPVQAPKLNTPLPLLSTQSPLAPAVAGRVRMMLPAGAPDCKVVVKALVPFCKMIEPVLVLAVPRVRLLAPVTVKVPVTVTALPDSLSRESPMVPLAVNLASLPVVPLPIMPPPLPAQLPVLKQMVAVALPGSGRL